MTPLFPYQKDSVRQLCDGKYIIRADPGTGKSAVMVKWLEQQKAKKIIIATTASKVASGGFNEDIDKFASSTFRTQIDTLECVSWHMLYKWVKGKTAEELAGYTFCADECLPANAKVMTDKGERELGCLKAGDKVLSYNHTDNVIEYKPIVRTIKKKSPQKMIRLLLSNGTAIISTGNHPHFTSGGYKEAENIKPGDILYEERSIRKTEICTIKSSKIWGIHRMRHMPCKNISSDIKAESAHKTSKWEEKLLFNGMCQSCHEQEWETGNGDTRAKRIIEGKSYKENDRAQPVSRQGYNKEGISNKEEKRLATSMGKAPRAERRQRSLYRATNKIMESAKQDKQRLGDGTVCFIWQKRNWISNLLQTRCGKCILQNRNRMRWRRPQQPKSQSERQKENRQISPVRVESVEILELSDIKRFGLYRDPDHVYCIDVEENHNFFVNGILTHNCQRSKAGVSSQMGKAFLMITRYCKEWAGFTATPGDTWIDYHSYFIASGKVKNKTAFKRKFCIEQRYPFPKILAYQHEDTLKRWWGDISYSPDTSVVMGQLPPLTHQVIKLPAPKGYKKVLKTSTTLEGEPLESNMDLLHYLRQMCATPDKLSALSDLLETLSSPLVIFYNYRCEREQILELVSKMKRKVWRIDGECHDIPTADTIGNTDIVLCHYLSGSEALNLQFCNYWLSYSYNYSYSTTRQAMGRIRRVGQAKPQFYYWLRCEKTIEDEVAKALSKKQDFVEELWENNY